MAITKKEQPEEPRKLDEAPQPGGVYIRDGQVVDAEGNVLDDWSVDSNGNAVKASTAPAAPKAESK
jgi:hypothetical protein